MGNYTDPVIAGIVWPARAVALIGGLLAFGLCDAAADPNTVLTAAIVSVASQ